MNALAEPLADDCDVAELVRVRGLVQGVGFRPTVWRLARRHGLRGWVANDGDGVKIRLCGPAAKIAAVHGRVAGAKRRRWRGSTGSSAGQRALAGGCGIPYRRQPARGRAPAWCPTRPPARTAAPRCWTRRSGATAIRLPTAPIAGRGCHHRGESLRPARDHDAAVRDVRRLRRANTQRPITAAFTHSRSPATPAGRTPGWSAATAAHCAGRDPRSMPSRRGHVADARRRSWRSRGWAASSWPAMRPTRRRWRGCARASAGRANRSR